MNETNLAQCELRLKDNDPRVRRTAVGELSDALHAGRISAAAESDVVNMHCHTFFSYNAYGHTPSSLAWLAKRRGFRVIGIVDFDVLDGVEEFLSACEILGVRGSAGLETRAYLPEFSTREMNSPGEPGVYYAMGIGFTASAAPAGAAEPLAEMRRQSERRNRSMVERLNAYLQPVAIDYAADVQSLTPAGNATERHILQAYVRAVRGLRPDAEAFWAEKLHMPADEVRAVMAREADFKNLVRATLMKRGGPGYMAPGSDAFPLLDAVHEMIAACGAMPCATWLDGTSAGEQAIEELLDLLAAKGAAAVNVVPDRNWNVPGEDVRRKKVRNLYHVAEVARRMDLPLYAGTEMNSPGQKLVDDFDAPALRPLRMEFLEGAYFAYGHTLLQRALGLGYQSDWARAFLPGRRERNAFYSRLGRLVPPGSEGKDRLRKLQAGLSPEEMLRRIEKTE
jgi:hypothetical protein